MDEREDTDQYAARCATIEEYVEAGTITQDEAAELMFGPDPLQAWEASR